MDDRADKSGRSSSVVIRNKTYDSLTTLNELQNKSKERVENQNRNVPLTTVENELSTKKEIQTGTENKKENGTYNFDFTNYSNPKMNISPDANKNMTKTQNNNISTSGEIKEQAKKRIESQNENVPKTEIKDEISTKKEIKTALDTKIQKDEDISIGIPNGLGNQYKVTGIEIKTADKNNDVSEESVAISNSKKIKTEVKKEFSTEKQLKTNVENDLKNNIHVSSKSKQIFESAKFRAKNKVEKEIIDSVKSELNKQEDLGTENISAIITATDNSIRGLREGKRTVEKVKSHLQSKREKKYYSNTVQANGRQNQVQTKPNSDKEYKIYSQIKNDTIKTSVKAKYDTNYSLSANAISVDKGKKGYEIINKTIRSSIKTVGGNNAVSVLQNTAIVGTATTGTTAVGATTAAATGGATAGATTVTTAGGAVVTASSGALPVIAIVAGILVVVIVVIALIIGLIGMLSPNLSGESGVDIDETKWITQKITQERENLVTEIKTLYNNNKDNYATITFSNTLNSSNVTLDNNLANLENDMYTVEDYVQAMQPVFHTLILEKYELSPSESEMEAVFDELWKKMNSLTTQETQQIVSNEFKDIEQNNSNNENKEVSEKETTETIIKIFTITLNTSGYYDLLNTYYLNDISILQAKTDITEEEKKRLNELNEYYTLCTTYADILQESGIWLENGIDGTSAYIPDGGYMPSEAYDDATVAAIFTEANKWLGTPYEMPPHMPTTFDCSGFVWYVFQNSGVKNWGRTTAQGIFDQCTPISIGEAKAGDLIFFQGTYDAGRTVTHIGIYCGDGTMIHAGNPVKRSNINTPYWQQHFYSFGRLN